MRRGPAPLIVALALAASACAHTEGKPGTAPRLTLEKCGLADVMQPLLCGDLAVPEDPAAPNGRHLTLNIVVVPALGEKTLPPLYDLEGGPGLPATGSAGFWTGDGALHRAHRDVVLVDQRGTGASQPLPCPVWAANPYRPVLDAQDVGDCRDTLGAVVDLRQYSTKNAVADLEAVRVALGHDKIDIAAISYGTRLAQEYLRAHPGKVRAMVLSGTLSPAAKLPLFYGKAAADVLSRLEAQCKSDADCSRAVPNLPADVAALQKRLESGTAKVARPGGGVATVLAGSFWEAIRAQLYSVTTQRKLPWLLHEAAAGRTAPLLAQIAPQADRAAMGALLAITCPEDTLKITDTELAAAGGGPFGTHRATQQLRACRVLGLPPVDTPREFVDSPVPALLLAGEMDPVTPLEQAQAVAAHWPNARVVQIPNLGHVVEGLAGMGCYDQLIADFFASGDAAKLDTGCVKAMIAPPFATGAARAHKRKH